VSILIPGGSRIGDGDIRMLKLEYTVQQDAAIQYHKLPYYIYTHITKQTSHITSSISVLVIMIVSSDTEFISTFHDPKHTNCRIRYSSLC
jgi:hypothetical protein